jgi:hypothetical protein
MRYWLDTEFIENESGLYLVSIGIVSHNGDEYYAEDEACDLDQGCQWFQQNVVPHLAMEDLTNVKSAAQIARDIRAFVGNDPYPEFWGYFADYDWVLFCRLFGGMLKLPDNWPQYCLDLKQLCYDSGSTFPLPPPDEKLDRGPIHHALADARWTKRAWEYTCNRIDAGHRLGG